MGGRVRVRLCVERTDRPNSNTGLHTGGTEAPESPLRGAGPGPLPAAILPLRREEEP
jgi:hypothetical protein